MEVWGRCPSCDRWFYCGTADDDVEDEGGLRCPVCDSEPTVVEHREPT